ncbi:MAG TPA: hypothetical protein DEO57_04125 [Phycisphaerales bacterium]|nr:hypothetical protein [Phycisphaerales bacterium]
MDVWLNGQFVAADSATIPVFDAGFQHGVGLFETMHAENGRVFRAREHVERLAESARMLRMSERLHVDPLVEAVQRTVEHNSLDRARVRLTVTGGDLNMLQSTGASPQDPTILVTCQPPTEYPDEFFAKGIGVVFAGGRLSPWTPEAGHKTLNYWPNILALQEAAAQRAGEAVWLTPEAHVACGCVSNVFIVHEGTLVTPVARDEEPGAVMPGITRAAVIELAESMNIPVERRTVSVDDFLGADEAFLTNSSWQILPVTSVLVRTGTGETGEDGEPVVGLQPHAIGEQGVGDVTSDLRTALLACIDRETS